MNFRFADPWLLLMLVVPLVVLLWAPVRGGRSFAPFAIAAGALRPSRGPLLARLLIGSALALLVLAAARPQYGQTITERQQQGRDLMLVIDLSGSMQVDDLTIGDERVDRLAGVMAAAKRFIAGREDDRIGLVFFGDAALTSCPPTYDHETVIQFLDRTEQQQRSLWRQGQEGLLGGSTNLGLGLGTALKTLRDPAALGKALILVTDGVDTRKHPQWVDPILAAKQAERLGVTVYGIGVGNPQGTFTRDLGFGRKTLTPVPPQLLPDLGRLQAIAASGNGQAFTATDEQALQEAFARIDRLQPTPRTVSQRDDVSDRFWWPLVAGAALLALALALEPRLRGVA